MDKIVFSILYQQNKKKFILPKDCSFQEVKNKAVLVFGLKGDFNLLFQKDVLREENFSQLRSLNSVSLKVVSLDLKANIKEFIEFNQTISSPYMATYMCEGYLKYAEFQRIFSEQVWQLQLGGKYYVKENKYASIAAFQLPATFDKEKLRFQFISTNLDFPCLRLTTESKRVQGNQLHFNVGQYGESEWRNWQNRDLKLGGRVIVQEEENLRCVVLNTDFSIGFLSNEFFNYESLTFFPLVGTK